MHSTSFFAALCGQHQHQHHACLTHPFVRAIGDGRLPDDVFRHYIEQDYQYLLHYIRAQATAIAWSPDLPTARRLAELVHGTLSLEIDGLVALYTSFGGTPAALDTAQPHTACQHYTDHLLACAASHDLLVIFASMLPCQWGYREIGRALRDSGLPDDSRYALWIESYASSEYGDLVDWLITRFDALASDADDTRRALAEEAFGRSFAHELAFWEMAYAPLHARHADTVGAVNE